MLKKRIIPVVLLKNGMIVQSKSFKKYQVIGSPTASVERLSSWASDELIYLDISNEPEYDFRRDDTNHPDFQGIEDIFKLVSERCFMPLTLGGGIRCIKDAENRIRLGADKIAINTMAIAEPLFVRKCAEQFGSQCVVISVDVKKEENGRYMVYQKGRIKTDINVIDHVRNVEKLGAGEILLNSVDLDGTGTGFDIELIKTVSENTKIPVIAMGGAGKWEHFAEVFEKTKIEAVAAANIFHYSENSVFHLKKYLFEKGFNVRKVGSLSNSSLFL